MTEIFPKHIANRIKSLSRAQRSNVLHAMACRLEPLTPGQIGMMFNTNSLEGAHRMMERINQKAYNAYREAVTAFKKQHPGADYPHKFIAPFWWAPNNAAEQQGKWTAKLHDAFEAHF